MKTAWFFIISFIVGRSLCRPEKYINVEIASKIGNMIYGDVNAEVMYETYTNIDILSVLIFTLIIYYVTIKVFGRIRV
jgi:hypothetical protein